MKRIPSNLVGTCSVIGALILCAGTGYYFGSSESGLEMAGKSSVPPTLAQIEDDSAEIDRRYGALFEELEAEVREYRGILNSLTRAMSASPSNLQQSAHGSNFSATSNDYLAYRDAVTQYEDSLLTLKIARQTYAEDKVALYSITK